MMNRPATVQVETSQMALDPLPAIRQRERSRAGPRTAPRSRCFRGRHTVLSAARKRPFGNVSQQASFRPVRRRTQRCLALLLSAGLPTSTSFASYLLQERRSLPYRRASSAASAVNRIIGFRGGYGSRNNCILECEKGRGGGNRGRFPGGSLRLWQMSDATRHEPAFGRWI